MIAYTRKQVVRLLKIDFVRFCLVGGTGFTINLVVLLTLRKVTHAPIFWLQLIAAEVALFSNFLLHHYWTYKHKNVQKKLGTLLIQFHASTWPAVLGSAVMVSIFERLLHFSDPLALVATSMISLGWNFTWSKFVIWRDVKTEDIEDGVA